MLTPTKNKHQAEKAIFYSQSYLESFIGFCDLCFAVVDCLAEVSYICQSCPSFLACLTCIKDPKQRLIIHSPEHLFTPYKSASNFRWTNRNLSITCDVCKEKNFRGKRYRCRHCCNYNVCSKCLEQAKRTHFPSEEHLFDFIPNPTRIRLNHSLLADRARQLLRYRSAGPSERDTTTGWTIDEATAVCTQMSNLYGVAWREAWKLLSDEDMQSSPNIIVNEKSDQILVPLSSNN